MREWKDAAVTLGRTLSLSGLGQVRFSQLEGLGWSSRGTGTPALLTPPNGVLSAVSLHTVLGHHLELMSCAAPANSPEVRCLV